MRLKHKIGEKKMKDKTITPSSLIISIFAFKIYFMNKIIKQLKWKEIDIIEEANIMRNPAIRIKALNGTQIHLDKRKKIINVIEIYFQKKIVK